jgi:dolichol-phosphate mannosyltransferase
MTATPSAADWIPRFLSVVIPMHNESGNVRPLIEEICTALRGQIDHEIICVNDGSTDDTAAELRALKSEHPELRVIHHTCACGQSTAVRSGVKAARGDWIATLDGDGQNDPADIPKLINALEPEVALVGGNRRHMRRDVWIKRVSSIIANGVRSRILRDSTPDTGCGLKLFRRDVFLDFPYFDHMHRFLPALAQRSGWRVVSVPVNHRPRHQGVSNYGTIDRLLAGIVDLGGVFWLLRRAKRPQVIEK